MAWKVDGRVAVKMVVDAVALSAELAAGPPAAVLAEAPPPEAAGAVVVVSFDPFMPHAVACLCCGGRSPAADALDRLFQARVRGQCGWFQRVIALAETPEARAQVAEALVEDALTAARFREV